MRRLAIALLTLGLLGAGVPALAAGNDNDVEWDGLFHDQGPLYASTSAPSCGDAVKTTFRTYKGDVTGVTLKYWDTADSAHHELPMTWSANDATGRFDQWTATIPASCSVKYYRFAVTDGSDTDWYNAGGTSDNEPSRLDFRVIPGFSAPVWANDAIFYQIFPDRFANGDTANDVKSGEYTYFDAPTQAKAWGDPVTPTPPAVASSVFFGGDLQGVSQRMPYLKDTLGINAVYFNPVFTSPTNHKYDTQDYFSVDRHLGGDAAFSKVVSDVHGFGGHVVLDGVFNHSGSWTPWFDRGNVWPDVEGAYESQGSPYFRFYNFFTWPDDYASFLNQTPSMPKFDFAASEVRDALYKGTDSVAQKWIRASGIDGWRLDAAQYADAGGGNGSNATNHEIWAEFRTAVKSASSNALVFGEQWGNAESWLSGGEWDGATNFNGFTQPVSRWITGKDYQGGSAALSTTEFDGWLRGTRADYPRAAQLAMSNHLSNHDIPRFATRAGGSAAKVGLAHIFQMTYVGMPTIYYGDEYGLEGGADPDNRRTMDWSRATPSNPTVALVGELTALRKKYAALRTGSFITLGVDDAQKVYAYGRMDKDNRIAVVLNNDGASHTYPVPVFQMSVPDGATMTDALGGKAYTVQNGRVDVTVPAGSGLILVH